MTANSVGDNIKHPVSLSYCSKQLCGYSKRKSLTGYLQDVQLRWPWKVKTALKIFAVIWVAHNIVAQEAVRWKIPHLGYIIIPSTSNHCRGGQTRLTFARYCRLINLSLTWEIYVGLYSMYMYSITVYTRMRVHVHVLYVYEWSCLGSVMNKKCSRELSSPMGISPRQVVKRAYLFYWITLSWPSKACWKVDCSWRSSSCGLHSA